MVGANTLFSGINNSLLLSFYTKSSTRGCCHQRHRNLIPGEAKKKKDWQGGKLCSALLYGLGWSVPFT